VAYLESAKMGHIFYPVVEGKKLGGFIYHASPTPAATFADSTGTVWNLEGLAVSGPLAGKRLPIAPSYDAFWFAWYDFFPTAPVFGN
jgi:hypothetical protein